MIELREQVVKAYITNHFTDLTYSEIEDRYEVPSTSRKGDTVRGWINWYKNKGVRLHEYAPGKKFTDLFIDNTKKSKVDKNLLLKSTWQVQKKGGEIAWLESYQNNINPEDVKAFRDQLIKDIPSPYNKVKLKPFSTYDTVAVVSIPDFHIGRDKNEENNVSKFLDTLGKLIEKSSHHFIGEVVFVIGNDYFNSDFDYKTTKGTPQFDYQNWKETWTTGRDILISAVGLLKILECKITIINVPGNHDDHRMFYLGDYVQGYYRNDNQVVVDNSDRLIKAFKYGDVLLAFEHGEFRREEYESILANEFPELWGSSKYREFLCGHLHAETVKEFRGLKLRHLPSLANESEWEKKQGYKHKKEAQLLIYSKNKLEAIYIE